MGNDPYYNTSWRTLIANRMEALSETWNDVVATTATDEQLDEVFNNSNADDHYLDFEVWTPKHVYFPDQYDGSMSSAAASRNPPNAMGVAGKIDALLAKIETERAKYDAAYDEALGCGDNASLVNGEMEDALDIIGRELAEIRKAITG